MPYTGVVAAQPTGNRVLDGLSSDAFAAIVPSLHCVTLAHGEAPAAPYFDSAEVYFPVSGMLSLVRNMADGEAVEIGVVGNEGVIGWAALIPAGIEAIEAAPLISLVTWGISTAALLRAMDDHREIRRALDLAVYSLFLQVTQTSACNQLHSTQQRLARWLLLARDHSPDREMSLTHEVLASLLGVRRAGITAAIAPLREAGILTSDSGRIFVLDRHRLEHTACGCYRVIQQEMASLAPPTSFS